MVNFWRAVRPRTKAISWLVTCSALAAMVEYPDRSMNSLSSRVCPAIAKTAHDGNPAWVPVYQALKLHLRDGLIRLHDLVAYLHHHLKRQIGFFHCNHGRMEVLPA